MSNGIDGVFVRRFLVELRPDFDAVLDHVRQSPPPPRPGDAV
jgi:hypothetical protein